MPKIIKVLLKDSLTFLTWFFLNFNIQILFEHKIKLYVNLQICTETIFFFVCTFLIFVLQVF